MPLSDLDTDQRNFASSCKSEVLVSAGAGSGKTRLLVGRYLHLASSDSIPLSSIVAITFTDKAANQMKSAAVARARELADKYPEKREWWLKLASEIPYSPISTIHGFCNSILRAYPREAGIDPQFKIADSTTVTLLIGEAVESYYHSRLENDPEITSELLDSFGVNGLKKLFRFLLTERSRLKEFYETFSDSISSEQIFEKRFNNGLTDYIYNLKEFHAFGPREDRLYPNLDSFIKGLENLKKNPGKNYSPEETIELLSLFDKSKRAGGSPNRWGEYGHDVKKVRGRMKECSELVEDITDYLCQKDDILKLLSIISKEYILLNEHFLNMKKERSCFDHDDTLLETWKLLRMNPSLTASLSSSYRHILVDEFQDTDRIQMDILKMITGNSACGLFAVGDAKQSIYRFRGADVSVFNEFHRSRIDNGYLKVNYRSTEKIVNFVNLLFEQVMGKEGKDANYDCNYSTMKSSRKNVQEEKPVEIAFIEGGDVLDRRRCEAGFIAGNIETLRGKGVKYGDMAIIVRKGTQISEYEKTLLSRKIPFVNQARTDPFKTPEAYDIMNLLGWACGDKDISLGGLLMSPFFGITPESLYGMKNLAGDIERLGNALIEGRIPSEHPSLCGEDVVSTGKILKKLTEINGRVSIREFIETAIDLTNSTFWLISDPLRGELSLAVVDAILGAADAFEKNGGTMSDFHRLLVDGQLSSNESVSVESEEDAVTIITIHKAKGLQYKAVFLADITSKPQSNPGFFSMDTELGIGFKTRNRCGEYESNFLTKMIKKANESKELAESKRLFYVGCTRAEDYLFISGGNEKWKDPKPPEESYERNDWMEWLRTALLSLPEGCKKNNSFLLHDLEVSSSANESEIANYWKKTLDSDEEPQEEHLKRISGILEPPLDPVEKIDISVISTSKLLDYIECPGLYAYRHVHGLTGNNGINKGSGAGKSYGTFFHGILEKWDFRKGAGQLQTLLLPHINLEESWTGRLVTEIESFMNSSVYKLISSSETIHREQPFAFFHESTLINGTLDIRYGSRDKYSIMDYKTDKNPPSGNDPVSDRYRNQMEIYCLACYKSELIIPEKALVYYSTTAALSEIDVSENSIEKISDVIDSALEGMARGDYSPSESQKCSLCPYNEICMTKTGEAEESE